MTAEDAVRLFEHDLAKMSVFHPAEYKAFIAPLRGKNLACFCKLSACCHADTLLVLALANGAP